LTSLISNYLYEQIARNPVQIQSKNHLNTLEDALLKFNEQNKIGINAGSVVEDSGLF